MLRGWVGVCGAFKSQTTKATSEHRYGLSNNYYEWNEQLHYPFFYTVDMSLVFI